MRRVCCVSLNFPPSTIASVHRARHLAKHLPCHGWQPTVVCVDERDLNETLDWRLLEFVDKCADVRKIRAFPLEVAKKFGVTDLGMRAYWSLRRHLTALFRSENYDVVFITGWPFYQMTLASYIKRGFQIPVVLDFQDPWVSSWGNAQPLLSKAGASHWLGTILEPRVLRHADFVTSVSEVQNAEMARRYPWFDASRMAAIPIGGDPDDFRISSSLIASENLSGPIHLNYVGTFLPRSEPLVRVLFRAFSRLRQKSPMLASRMRLNFIGTSNQSDDSTPRVHPIAKSEGVADAVTEIPQRLPYIRALDALVESQGILLIGSDEPHYTASKIYPALMSRRPYLSLFHSASSAHSILSASGGGRAFAFSNREQLDALESALCDGLKDIAMNPALFGVADQASYEPYLASNIAARFAAIFNKIGLARID